MSDELLYMIAFTSIAGINDIERKKLLLKYGSAKNIFFDRKQNTLIDWPLKEAEAELAFMHKHTINAFSILDDAYPNRLLHCADAPTLLYHKGTGTINLPQLISIVGSRQHTIQVEKVIQELLEGLTHLKIGVVSGLALGVDGIAHACTLKMGMPTWGVVAHGLDQLYPSQHRKLAIAMLEQGGLWTECRKGMLPLTFQFPKRNRIVAGMTDATIVVETDVKGGSMITAGLAFHYDREVFAVPGKIHDQKSKGCLTLIKHNKAQVYHDPIHFLENMQWPPATIESNNHSNNLSAIQSSLPLLPLEPQLQKILHLIETKGPIHRDNIAIQLHIETSKLSGDLLALEMQGLIYMQAGNSYARL